MELTQGRVDREDSLNVEWNSLRVDRGDSLNLNMVRTHEFHCEWQWRSSETVTQQYNKTRIRIKINRNRTRIRKGTGIGLGHESALLVESALSVFRMFINSQRAELTMQGPQTKTRVLRMLESLEEKATVQTWVANSRHRSSCLHLTGLDYACAE